MNNSLDMRVNERVLELNEKAYKLDFDMQAFSYAEQVYREQFDRDVNVAVIIRELFDVKMSAVMAFCYGAMRSGGEAVTWQDFSKHIFTYSNFDTVFDVVAGAIEELFASDGEDAEGEGPEDAKKN